MGTAQKQHAIRRSTRLPLEIPVLVTSSDAGVPLSARGKTTLVNAHGCGLILDCAVPNGIRVRLEIVSADRHTTGRVAEVVPLGGDPETWLLGVELDNPGNFWGIEYAPADWKIENLAQPSEQRREVPAPAEAKPAAGGRRWRLTDISVGGCYLEAASPIPVGTLVLVSIRIADKECLLDGVVRASHPQSGMGIEFISSARDHQHRVEELISQLMHHREVPRVLVGRKEGANDRDRKAALDIEDPTDPPDPLLALIRQGAALPVEQFLDNLKAQRLGKRSEPRTEASLLLLLTGTDVHGRPLDQQVSTVNVSKRGALLDGIHGRLRPGDAVFLARGNKQEQFRVAWVGSEETTAASQIGVVAVASESALWDQSLNLAELPFEADGVHNAEAQSQKSRAGRSDT